MQIYPAMVWRSSLYSTLVMTTIVVTAAGMYFVPKLIPGALLEQLLKFSAMCVGGIWGLSYYAFTRLADITEISGIDYRQHQRLEGVVRKKIRRFWIDSILLFIFAVTLTVPSLLTASCLSVPAVIWPLEIGALGGCLVLLCGAIQLSEELRAFRSAAREDERREKERATQLAELRKIPSPSDWERDPRLNGFRGEPDSDT